jgi:hypothetical protein
MPPAFSVVHGPAPTGGDEAVRLLRRGRQRDFSFALVCFGVLPAIAADRIDRPRSRDGQKPRERFTP